MKCRHCGHQYAPRPQSATKTKTNLTAGELMEPARLVHLFATRADLADTPNIGARLAAGVTEGV